MSRAGLGARVSGLIEPDCSASRKGERRQKPPTLIIDVSGCNPFALKSGPRVIDVIAHQIKFVAATCLSRMTGNLRRRQCEYQPAIANIDILKAQNILEKISIRFGIFGVDHDMSTVEHRFTSPIAMPDHSTIRAVIP